MSTLFGRTRFRQRRRHDSRASSAIDDIGRRLARSMPHDELFLQLVEVMQDHFAARSAELWSERDGCFDVLAGVPRREVAPFRLEDAERVAAANTRTVGRAWLDTWIPAMSEPDGEILVAPCVFLGDVVGFLRVTRSRSNHDFTPEDEDTVLLLAQQVALALHNSRLHADLLTTMDELVASRARLVAAADEARRRIERDIHDGAQQRLTALVLDVEILRRAGRSGQPPDDSELAALADGIRAAVTEVRNLAHGIYPPALEEAGLGGALEDLAERSTSAIHLDRIDVGRHAAAIEAAVYFCITESIQNVGKHCRPEVTVTIEVAEVGGDLVFAVRDDGPGFDVAAQAESHGLTNMRDRVGALGGALTIRSGPDGTHIGGRIPSRPLEVGHGHR
jgi:signal transduction histidine kinase